MRGQVMPIDQAHIGVLDWGLSHSNVTYDVVPVWRGGFFRLEDYLDRCCQNNTNKSQVWPKSEA